MIIRKVRRLKSRDWPEIDQVLWRRAQQPGSAFRKGGHAAMWRPDTVAMIEGGYGVFLWWLQATSQLDTTVAPIARVTVEVLEQFEAFYAPGRAPLTVASVIRGIAYVVKATSPPDGLPWLTKLAHYLVNTADSIKPKLPRMVHVGELVLLGGKLMATGRATLANGGRSGAQLYRDGFMIEMFARVPLLRRRNMCELRLGQSLIREQAAFHVQFEPAATKTKVRVSFDLPHELFGPLEYYLDVARPYLLSTAFDEGWLWIGRRRRPLSRNNITALVTKATMKHLGRPISPHLFRDIYATDVALFDSENVGLTKDGMMHATLDTSQEIYNHATAVEAMRRLGGVIGDILE